MCYAALPVLLNTLTIKHEQTNEIFAHGFSYTIIIFSNITWFLWVFVRVLTTPISFMAYTNAKYEHRDMEYFVCSNFGKASGNSHNWADFHHKTYRNSLFSARADSRCNIISLGNEYGLNGINQVSIPFLFSLFKHDFNVFVLTLKQYYSFKEDKGKFILSRDIQYNCVCNDDKESYIYSRSLFWWFKLPPEKEYIKKFGIKRDKSFEVLWIELHWKVCMQCIFGFCSFFRLVSTNVAFIIIIICYISSKLCPLQLRICSISDFNQHQQMHTSSPQLCAAPSKCITGRVVCSCARK